MGKHEEYVKLVNKVFNEAKKARGYKTDLELANELDENKVAMSQYRSGVRVINDWKLLRLVKVANMETIETLRKIIFCKSPKKDAEEVILNIISLLEKLKNLTK